MKITPFNKDLPFTIPTKGSEHAAGYDLSYVGNPIMLMPMQRHALPTNIVMEIPEGFYGRIAPRSGLAFKEGIVVIEEVISPKQLDEVRVNLVNLSHKPVSFSSGQQIAQIIISPFIAPKLEIVKDITQES